MTIYSQYITGRFRKIKDYSSYLLLFIYFGFSWIRWSRGEKLPDQAILMDLPNRKAYLFGIEIWPEESYYIAGMLILAALGLFFITSLFGRIWCGYTCPHTVFVDLFIKIEHFFQGDRNSRIKLDSLPYDKSKLIKKGLTFACWLMLSFSFAFGWVCYFYDAPTLVHDIINFQVTSGGMGWLISLTASTFLFAGYIRERVCTYMCPYGRFQSVMLDKDTSIVTYHDWRGEPRGKQQGAGDCIDCGKCVVVCPMGIDIRDGLQMPCIGCGLCIDACNTVMEKLSRPLNLISYDSENSTELKKRGITPAHKKVLQFKTLLFAAIFIIVSALMLYSLLNRPKITMSVLRDHGALFTMLPDGGIRNFFTVKISNKSPKEKKMSLQIEGLVEYKMKVQTEQDYSSSYTLFLPGEGEREVEMFVRIPVSSEYSKSKNIIFILTDEETGEKITYKSIFITGKE